MTPSSASTTSCPRCGLPGGPRRDCTHCGFPTRGPEVERLRLVLSRLERLRARQSALEDEAAALERERIDWLARLDPIPPPPPPPPASPPSSPSLAAPAARGSRGHTGDWRPETVQNFLLTVGALLLVIAALVFAVVAWSRLGDGGRFALLLGFTAIAGAATFATQRRLPMTAEALGGVTLALLLVDWYAARRGGVGADMSAEAWWALGTAMTAAAALALGHVLRLDVGRTGGAGLTVVAGFLSAEAGTATDVGAAVARGGVGIAAAAAAGTILGQARWARAGRILSVGAVIAGVAVMATAAGFLPPDDGSEAARAVTLIALAGGIAASGRIAASTRIAPSTGDALVALAAAAAVGAVAVVLAVDLGGPALVVAIAWIGVIAVTVGRLIPPIAGRGTAATGALAAGLGVVLGLHDALAAAFGALGWLEVPWTGSLSARATDSLIAIDAAQLTAGAESLAGLAAATMAAAVSVWPLPDRTALVDTRLAALIGLACLVASVPLAPVAAGATVVTTLAIILGAAAAFALAGAAVTPRSGPAGEWLAGAGALLLIPAAGWAAVTETATLWSVAVVCVTAVVVTVVTGERRIGIAAVAAATATAVAEAGLVAFAAEERSVAAGVATVGAAGVLVVVAQGIAERRRLLAGAVEATALAGLIVGLGMTFEDHTARSFALTACVGFLAVAGAVSKRAALLWGSTGLAVLTVWSWNARAAVELVEAYTLPAAGIALVAGLWAGWRRPELSSWQTLGPALITGMVPTLILALAEGGAARPLLLVAAAVVAVVAGWARSLQAPLVIGSASLVVLGLDTLGPVAAQLPRWVTLGAAGLIAIWLGATTEARWADIRQARERFEAMD